MDVWLHGVGKTYVFNSFNFLSFFNYHTLILPR